MVQGGIGCCGELTWRWDGEYLKEKVTWRLGAAMCLCSVIFAIVACTSPCNATLETDENQFFFGFMYCLGSAVITFGIGCGMLVVHFCAVPFWFVSLWWLGIGVMTVVGVVLGGIVPFAILRLPLDLCYGYVLFGACFSAISILFLIVVTPFNLEEVFAKDHEPPLEV